VRVSKVPIKLAHVHAVFYSTVWYDLLLARVLFYSTVWYDLLPVHVLFYSTVSHELLLTSACLCFKAGFPATFYLCFLFCSTVWYDLVFWNLLSVPSYSPCSDRHRSSLKFQNHQLQTINNTVLKLTQWNTGTLVWLFYLTGWVFYKQLERQYFRKRTLRSSDLTSSGHVSLC